MPIFLFKANKKDSDTGVLRILDCRERFCLSQLKWVGNNQQGLY